METITCVISSLLGCFLGYKLSRLCSESKKNSAMIKEMFDDWDDLEIDNHRYFSAVIAKMESIEDKLNLMALFQENKSTLPVTEKQKPIRTRTEKQKESTSKKMKEWWAARKEQTPTTHTIKLSPVEIHSDEKAL